MPAPGSADSALLAPDASEVYSAVFGARRHGVTIPELLTLPLQTRYPVGSLFALCRSGLVVRTDSKRLGWELYVAERFA